MRKIWNEFWKGYKEGVSPINWYVIGMYFKTDIVPVVVIVLVLVFGIGIPCGLLIRLGV